MAAPLGALSPAGSVFIGVTVGLISTCVQSLGLTLQRKSHILEDEKLAHHVRRPPYRRRRWQLGMLMFIFSNIVGSSIQITTLPLPVLSTLQASGLVFNAICASVILGEPFTPWSLGGTTLVCIGAVLIATFGAMKEPAHTLDQLLELLARRAFIAWMIGQALLVVVILVVAKSIKLVDPRAKHKPGKRLARGIAYGCVSGILSAHSLLLAKSAVELLVRSIFDRNNQFNRWQSWMILLGLVAFALTQLYYLNRGLKLCSTSILYPLTFCVYNITAILDGLIYFRQTAKLSALHDVLIALGTVILLAGVLALSWRLDHHDSQKHATPRVGFIDDPEVGDELDEEIIDDTTLLNVEEAVVDPERRPLLRNAGVRRRSQDLNGFVEASAKYKRRRATLEAAEIWNELEDDGGRGGGDGTGTSEVGLSSLSSPVFWRRASMPLPPQRVSSREHHQRHRDQQEGDAAEDVGAVDAHDEEERDDGDAAGPIKRSGSRAQAKTTADSDLSCGEDQIRTAPSSAESRTQPNAEPSPPRDANPSTTTEASSSTTQVDHAPPFRSPPFHQSPAQHPLPASPSPPSSPNRTRLPPSPESVDTLSSSSSNSRSSSRDGPDLPEKSVGMFEWWKTRWWNRHA